MSESVFEPTAADRVAERESSQDTWLEASSRLTIYQDDEHRCAVIGLASECCVSFTKSRQDLKLLRNPSMLKYELENFVPIDGDHLAVDRIDNPVMSLIIAVDAKAVEQGLAFKELDGPYVCSICPQIFLALAGLRRTHDLSSFDIVAWYTESGTDVVFLRGGVPERWRWIHQEADNALDLLKTGEEDVANKILFLDPTEKSRESISGFQSIEFLSLDQGECAYEQAQQILCGRASGWVDLRNGLLASPNPLFPLKNALIGFVTAFFLMQFILLGTMIFRSQSYLVDTKNLITEQENTFNATFPGEPVPVGMVSRLRSEHRELLGTRGGSGVPKLRSVMPITHRLLSGLPESDEIRYQIDRLEFLPDQLVVLTGKVRSFEELEQFAQAIRNVGLIIPPVSGNQSNNGVSLRLENVLIEEHLRQ